MKYTVIYLLLYQQTLRLLPLFYKNFFCEYSSVSPQTHMPRVSLHYIPRNLLKYRVYRCLSLSANANLFPKVEKSTPTYQCLRDPATVLTNFYTVILLISHSIHYFLSLSYFITLYLCTILV